MRISNISSKIAFNKYFKKIIITLIAISFMVISIININNYIGFYPSEKYLKNCTTWSIQKANNFSWENYKGKEGSEFFTQKLKNELFGDTIDLKYLQKYKVNSEGGIEKFTNIDLSKPSITFITYRKITDKNGTNEFKKELTFEFKFEGYHWLINNITPMS